MVSTRLQGADYNEDSLAKGSDVIDISFPTDRQLFKTLRVVLPRVTTFPSHINKGNADTYDVEVSRIKISADELLTGQFMVDLRAETPLAVFDSTNVFKPMSTGVKYLYAAYENPIVLDADRDTLVLYFTIRENTSLTNFKIAFETQYGQAEFRRSSLALDGSIKEVSLPDSWESSKNGGKAHWTYDTADSEIDLSTEGTANCYVMRPNTTYKFRVDKKGNGADYVNATAGTNALGSYSAAINLSSNKLKAVLLWEATLDSNSSTGIIATDGVSYQDSFIYVTTGPSQGNAVVALEDKIRGQYQVLWSWHIWVANDADVINAKSGVDPVRKMMLRNLGAYDNEEIKNHPQNRGLLYQWGRKDPFLSCRVSNNETAYRTEAIGDGEGVWNDVGAKNYSTNMLAYSVENPMCFIKSPDGAKGKTDWFYKEAVFQNNLWGGGYFVKDLNNNDPLSNTLTNVTAKTIFDPCPVGYRMPVVGVYGYISRTPMVSGYVNEIWEYMDNEYGARTIGGVFFPITGRLECNKNTYMAFDALNYWLGSTAANIVGENMDEGVDKRSFSTTMYIKHTSGYPNNIRVEPSNFAEKATARPVRCVLEDYFVSYYDWSGEE